MTGRESGGGIIGFWRSSTAASLSIPKNRRQYTMGRGKVELKKIHNPISRQVTFSKRKAGLLKKTRELSLLCDAEIALIIFSPTGKLHEFASPSMNRVMGKYQKICASTGHCMQLSENVETLRLEEENLRNGIAHLEKMYKYMIGEDLESLSFKKLQRLEKQINLGARKIRSRKHRSLIEENSSLREELGRSHEASDTNIDITETVNDNVETDAATQQDLSQTTLNLRQPLKNLSASNGPSDFLYLI